MAPKSELVRLALISREEGVPARVVIDLRGRLQGRGAYLCRVPDAAGPAPVCAARASRRGGLSRAFRRPVAAPDLVESRER